MKNRDITKPRASLAPRFTAWACCAAVFLVTICFSTRTYYTSAVKDVFFMLFGGVMLALWVFFDAKKFNKERMVFYAPLMLFVAYNIISFLFNPYKINSFEDFLLHTLTYGLPLFIAPLLDARALKLINKIFMLTCALCYAYGAAQAVDIWLWQGADVFSWARAFGPRVFSTLANPNFFGNFLSFSLLGVLVNFIYFKEKKYIALFILGVIDLYFTESKGAWLAFGGGVFLFALGYANLFLKKHKLLINSAGALVVLCAVALSVVFAFKREQSVSFRLQTWRGVLAAAAAAPAFGHGEGAFKTIYPKYRRPQIFYIEKIHNNETAHAENEYLETLVNGGALGVLLFLFFIGFLFFKGVKKLKVLAGAGTRAPPEAYFLFGALLALAVIYAHNFFDVSLRFSSSAVFAALFIAVVIFLTQPGENKFSIKKLRPALAPAILIPLAAAVTGFYYFKAGEEANIAHYYMRNNNLQGAINMSTKAIKHNPFNTAMRRLRAFAFSQRNTKAKTHEPFAGDGKNEYLTDFERAQKDYQAIARISPYEALHNFDYGLLLYNRAVELPPQEAVQYLSMAEAQFKAALALDPVLHSSYLALTKIEIYRGNIPAAREWVLKYLRGPEAVHEQKYLDTHKNNPDVLRALDVVNKML